jgi:uncharacterized protein
MKSLAALFCGMVFGFGIAISGMINPAKVVNFFDLAGTWDPSLMFVMGGALAVAFTGYRLIFARRPAPLLDGEYFLPKKTEIDKSLIGGSALFGVGWGISGFCPGGALPALGIGGLETIVFIAALSLGLLAGRWLKSTPPSFASA